MGAAGVAEVRGGEAGESHHHRVSFVVLRQTRRYGQKGFAVDLGQRKLAQEQIRQKLEASHNREVRETGLGVRIVVCFLPKKSPWLNPIEPMWVHAKRKVVEPDELLSADELAERVCGVFGCAHESHLAIPKEVA
jgi:transposase